MLQYFLDWGAGACVDFLSRGIEATLTRCESTSNTGAVLDIWGQGRISRITAWDSGDVYLESLDVETGATVYSKALHLSPPFLFDEEFSDFFAKLK